MADYFYMNYVQGSNSPTVKYTNRQEAIKEAERLCEVTKSQVFTLVAFRETKPLEKFSKTDLINIDAIEEYLPF